MKSPERSPGSARGAAALCAAVLLGALVTALGRGRTEPRVEEPRPSSTARFVVQLERPPLVRYGGELPWIPRLTRDVRGKLELDSWQARAYLSVLDREQQAFRAALARVLPRAAVQWSYRVLFNGVTVRAPRAAAATLARLPGVRRVRSTDRRLYTPVMDVSLPLIGAPQFWDGHGGIGIAGSGVKVAVIDTGIDINNPFFDPGSQSYPAGFPKGATAYTTPKVIAARAYFRPDDPVNTVRDEPNPMDHLGHGSHVAGTIAGVAGTVFDLGGYLAPVSGVAPRAQLMNYKVFYRAESGTEGAHEPELMAAFEDAVLDGADILSNSWGGPDIFGDADPAFESYANAIEAGCVVVFAAGNDGPGETSMGSPGSYGPFITVGSVNTGRDFIRYFEVTAPTPVDPELTGILMSVGRLSASFSSDVGPAPLRSSHLVDGGANLDGCLPFSPGVFDGAIALVYRGDCSFTEKINSAVDASALAVIVHNDDPAEAPFRMNGDDVLVPAVMVSYDDGNLLRDWIELHGDAEGVIRTGYIPRHNPEVVDEVVHSSSRGPTAGAVLKPDIAAPGQLILSADAHRVDSSSTQIWGWKSGTSMATPHVSGAAALLKQTHPSWTHREIKSALVGRATRAGITSWIEGSQARPWEVGGGRLAVDRLLDIRLLAEPAVLSLGEGEPGDEIRGSVRLERVADELDSATVMWDMLTPLSGMSVAPLHGEQVSVSSGSATVLVALSIPDDADAGEYTGWIDFEDDGGSVTTVPYHFRVLPPRGERDLLIVDLSFATENERPDYVPLYESVAASLGMTYDLATVTTYYAAPTVPEMLRYRAVLVVTGDDEWNHFSTVGRWTLDRISSYLLRGGRVIIAGQGPFRRTGHVRTLALTGCGSLESRPLYDEATEGLLQQGEYRVAAIDHPQLVTGDIDLAPGHGVGQLVQLGELFFAVGYDLEYELWSHPVLQLSQGNFQGYGYVGMVYDPFPWYGTDQLAEAHQHRAVVLGFGLELINEPPDATSMAPGSRLELMWRAFNWVADRAELSVRVMRQDLETTLDASAVASTSVTDFEYDFGDGSALVESSEPTATHSYERYGTYEVTVIARSATGAAAVWRRRLEVQPGAEGIDAGVLDAGPAGDADATIIEEPRKGCSGCDAAGGGSELPVLILVLAVLPWLRRRR
ncbi:MAG: S8 family serine peptidase [bacterium]